MASCIVCGIDIEQQTASPNTGYGGETYPPAQTEYRGTVYQFCSSDHKEQFQAAPQRFVDIEQ